MPRSLLSIIIIPVCVVTLCCKSYTAGLQQSSTQVDDLTAIANLKNIAQAQTAFSVRNGGDYGTLEQLVAGGYLDTRFSGTRPKLRGFAFTVNANKSAGGSSYSCNADPDGPTNSAGRHFYLDFSSPVIRVNATRPATASDEVLQP
ncbi:MAG: hypothetical protein ABI967_11915 [bacterium]